MRLVPLLLTVLALALAACNDQTSSSAGPPPALPSTSGEEPPERDRARATSRDTLTVTGVLIDAVCHARFPDTADTCEGTYVAKGYPVGLQAHARADSVWLLVTVPQALGDYLQSPARVTGVVRSDGVLIPLQLSVRAGEGWASVL